MGIICMIFSGICIGLCCALAKRCKNLMQRVQKMERVFFENASNKLKEGG